MSPLRWLGLGGEVRALRVPLFRGYREKRDAPFVGATVAIKASAGRRPSLEHCGQIWARVLALT